MLCLVGRLCFGQLAARFVQIEHHLMGETNGRTALVEHHEFAIVVIGAGQAGLAVS
jgi:hypothetical protein